MQMSLVELLNLLMTAKDVLVAFEGDKLMVFAEVL